MKKHKNVHINRPGGGGPMSDLGKLPEITNYVYSVRRLGLNIHKNIPFLRILLSGRVRSVRYDLSHSCKYEWVLYQMNTVQLN